MKLQKYSLEPIYEIISLNQPLYKSKPDSDRLKLIFHQMELSMVPNRFFSV